MDTKAEIEAGNDVCDMATMCWIDVQRVGEKLAKFYSSIISIIILMHINSSI